MGYLIHAVYFILSLFPGSAARTHRPCGRMGLALRTIVGIAGSAFVTGAVVYGRAAYAGFEEGTFGYFPAIALALLAVFLLSGGALAVVRAWRNPPPPSLPDNVIAFRRSAKPIGTYRRRGVE
jgi:hypothetical protein